VLALVAGGLAEAHAKSLDAKQMAVYAQVEKLVVIQIQVWQVVAI
jgi:hypothetical protein